MARVSEGLNDQDVMERGMVGAGEKHFGRGGNGMF